MSFSADVAKYAKKTGLTLQKSVVAICAEASRSIIEMTPVDTGRAQGNWYASINTIDTSTSEERKKAEALSIANNEAKKAYGKIFNLTSNLPYIKKLEYGWSKQAPTGMVRITTERVSLALKRI